MKSKSADHRKDDGRLSGQPDPGEPVGDLFDRRDVGAGRPSALGKKPGSSQGASPGGVLVGTSGYSFDDWVGRFYPSGIRKGDMLSYYVEHFPVVEVNSTYYRIPNPTVLHQMERKTPPGFEFIIKAHKSMTHSRDAGQEEYAMFKEVLEPIQDAGKFSGVLLQFPWGFKKADSGGEKHLESLRENLEDIPLFAEFRNADWISDDTFELLRRLDIGYCCVDEPKLKGLVPGIVEKTSEDGYVRLHGRNARNWWRGGSGRDRYDYLYSEDELKEWVGKIRKLAAEAKKTYVFFNNCHAGQAATNAKLMQALLKMK